MQFVATVGSIECFFNQNVCKLIGNTRGLLNCSNKVHLAKTVKHYKKLPITRYRITFWSFCVHLLLLFPEDWKYINWKFGQTFCSIALLEEFEYHSILQDTEYTLPNVVYAQSQQAGCLHEQHKQSISYCIQEHPTKQFFFQFFFYFEQTVS